MFDKYEIKTYPEYCIIENSESDSENELSNLPFKKATNINEDDYEYPDENITPSLLDKANDKINQYQRSNTNRRKTPKEQILRNNKMIQKPSVNTYNSELINKSGITPSNSSKNKNRIINNKSNEINNKSKRINLNQYFNMTKVQLPQRTLKKYQNQFLDVENIDNFRVLSYRPEDYQTSYNKENGKSKIIQIFKKQEASELYFPSKRAKSPPYPNYTLNSSGNKKEEIDKNNILSFYQTPSLKFQSFFGSFIGPKSNKNISQSKSTSKSKVNQLQDFNIEKLIEIGDNSGTKWKNILAFGNKIKQLRNLNKMQKFKTQEKLKYKAKTEKNINEEEDKEPKPIIQRIKLNNKDYNILRSSNNSKKIFYHGQFKRKRGVNKIQVLSNPSDLNHTTRIKINPLYQISNQNDQNLGQSKMVVRSRRINTSVNNNNNKNISYNSNYNPNKNRKKIIKSNPKIQENEKLYQIRNNNINDINGNINNNVNISASNYNNRRLKNRNNSNGIINKISPIKILNKTPHIDISNKRRKKAKNSIKIINNNNNNNGNNNNNNRNNNLNNSLKNYNKINTSLEGIKYINYASMNKDKYIQKEKSEKNVLEEIKEIDYNESNENELIEKNKKINIKMGFIPDDEKFKKININNGAIRDSRNNHQKDNKRKRYYGYDDRHNLEGTINNHSIYYSVHTTKTDKIN